jgi:hypothetical protein
VVAVPDSPASDHTNSSAGVGSTISLFPMGVRGHITKNIQNISGIERHVAITIQIPVVTLWRKAQ